MAGMFKGVAVGGVSDGFVISGDISPMKVRRTEGVPAIPEGVEAGYRDGAMDISVYHHHSVVIGSATFDFWALTGMTREEALLYMLRAYGKPRP